MNKKIKLIKRKLDETIEQFSKTYWMYTKTPDRDFIRNRKLPFKKVVSFLLSLEGGTLTTEMLKYFGYSKETATSSAMVQQRMKIRPDAFAILFNLFVEKTDTEKTYKGLRLIAADGSDIQIPTNPKDKDSFFPGAKGQASYNLMHLDAMYDLLQNTYVDVILVGDKKSNENRNLCTMVDRSLLKNALVIADRGYENYNLMAHIQEKGWKYIIRIKDIGSPKSISSALTLPNTDEFDMFVDLSLTSKSANEIKKLLKDKNHYRYVPNGNFDYLPKKNRKYDKAVFYQLPFRIVRFKISNNSYETVVTNLDKEQFPSVELKKIYAMRWGIETSFRDLKYTVGLLHFHSKRTDFVCQEIYARLIMYNFSQLITSAVIINNSNKKYLYKVNFSTAVHICRRLFYGEFSITNVECLLKKYITPIRTGRSRPRKASDRHTIFFTYRVA